MEQERRSFLRVETDIAVVCARLEPDGERGAPFTATALNLSAGGAKLEGFGFLSETLADARKDIVETLAAHHASKPDAPGLQPERLRIALRKRWPAPVFKALLDQELRAKTVMVDGAFLRRGSVSRAQSCERRCTLSHLLPDDRGWACCKVRQRRRNVRSRCRQAKRSLR